MKKILIILALFIAGCKIEPKPARHITINIAEGSNLRYNQIDSLIDALPKNDSVIQITGLSRGPKERYFFISYSSETKDYSKTFSGDVYFSCDGFPDKHFIDSIAFGVNNKKEYQDLVITSIYEFQSKQDFDTFCK